MPDQPAPAGDPDDARGPVSVRAHMGDRMGWRLPLTAVAWMVGLLAFYAVTPLDGDRWWLGVLLALTAVVAVVPITVRRIDRIKRSPHPVGEALVAVTVITGLVIVAFACINYALGTNSDQIPGIHTKIDAFYYTVVTSTSVGYGDITPTGQGARVMATVQIVLTLALLGSSVRMVAGVARQRRDQPDPPDPPA